MLSYKHKVKKHKNIHLNVFYMCYFLLIALPHSTNIGFDGSKFTNINIGGKQVFIPFLIIIICFINSLLFFIRKKKCTYLTFAEILMVLLGFISAIYLIIGWNSYGILAFYDYMSFLFHGLIFISGIVILDDDSLNKFFKITVGALTINAILLVLIKFIIAPIGIITLLDANGNRFGVANQSLYIFFIPFLFLVVYKKKMLFKRKIIIIFTLSMIIYLIILNASRSVMGCSLIGCILCYIVTFFNNGNSTKIRNKSKNLYFQFSKNIFLIVFIMIFIIFLINYLKGNNSFFITRIQTTINSISGDESLKSRDITNSYYSNLIREKIFGYGFGIYMPLIAAEGFFYQLTSFYSDQAFMSIFFKGGIVMIVTFVVFLITIYYYNTYLYNKTKDIKYLILLITVPLIIFNSGILCSQIIHAVPIYSFLYIYCAVITSRYKSNKLLYNKEL